MASPDSTERRLGQLAVALGVAFVGALVGYLLFVVVPVGGPTVLGMILVVLAGLIAFRIGGKVASKLLPRYNAAEVAVDGPITRDGTAAVPGGGRGTPADDIVEEIERADDDGTVQALLLRLNTPGGEIVPSDDIRNAAVDFDGPTVAYATDTCASGGYWIASGCDELLARDTSIVGSIGVIGSRIDATRFADELGLSYERFAAGEYKDAGTPLKEIDEDERRYLQGVVDDFYQHFVERVAQGRGVSPGEIRETEARVFIGERAYDRGLVDGLGTREDAVDRIEERLDRAVSATEFTPSRGVARRLSGGARQAAYAFGAGIAGRADDDVSFRL
jgi:protease-4